jgi:hypothetical protein
VAAEFIAELPAGYDERTQMTLTEDNRVVLAHPEHPPLMLSATGQWVALTPYLKSFNSVTYQNPVAAR